MDGFITVLRVPPGIGALGQFDVAGALEEDDDGGGDCAPGVAERAGAIASGLDACLAVAGLEPAGATAAVCSASPW